MKVIQAVGPFYKNEPISFNVPQSGAKYIKFGIQAPQAPWLSAVPHSTSQEEFVSHMVRFEIGDDNLSNHSFIINGNGILEFEDFYASSVVYIEPLQDMDAYTIIDIAFIEEESA